MSDRRTVKLGDVLAENRLRVSVEREGRYPMLGVYGFARGVILRGEVKGDSISARHLYRVAEGQIIYSRLKAFEGAFAVVPARADGRFVTNEFPTFDADTEMAVPEFISLVLGRPPTWDAFAARITGVGARRERLQVDDFLDMTIELPPVAEQARCVEVAGRSQTAVNSLGYERGSLLDLRAAVIEHEISKASTRVVRVSNLVKSIKSGTSLRCDARPAAAGEWGVLKLSAVRPGRFVAAENKAVPAGTPIPKAAVLQGGEILVTRSNTLDRVGHACLVGELGGLALVCPDLIYRLTAISDEVSPEFLTIALALRSVRRQMKDVAVGTSDSMKKISITSLREIEIPVPSLVEQLALTMRVRVLDQAAHAVEETYASAVALDRSLRTWLVETPQRPIDAESEAA